MTKGEGYRLEQTATLRLQKVTGSQDDNGEASLRETATMFELQLEQFLKWCSPPTIRHLSANLDF